MKRIALFAALAATSIAIQAAPVTYTIDNSHTYPYFTYDHLGFSKQTHRFTKTTGSITLDRKARTGSAEVTIDTTSVDTGYALFNEHIQAADYFDTANHDTITFKGNRVTFKGAQPARIAGDITIKGVTRPITFTVTHFNCGQHPMRKVETCGANATAKLKRSDFNMGKNAPLVSDEVSLTLAVEAFVQP